MPKARKKGAAAKPTVCFPLPKSLPAAAQRLDQLDTHRHLFHAEVHRRALVV
jgi:hypothetical protein